MSSPIHPSKLYSVDILGIVFLQEEPKIRKEEEEAEEDPLLLFSACYQVYPRIVPSNSKELALYTPDRMGIFVSRIHVIIDVVRAGDLISCLHSVTCEDAVP